MPRAGQVRVGEGERLTDRVALGVLTATFTRSLVDEVIEITGRREQRNRMLPAHLVVYYVLAMTLFSSAGYEEVMRSLTEGLTWSSDGEEHYEVPPRWRSPRHGHGSGPNRWRSSSPGRVCHSPLKRPRARSIGTGAWYPSTAPPSTWTTRQRTPLRSAGPAPVVGTAARSPSCASSPSASAEPTPSSPQPWTPMQPERSPWPRRWWARSIPTC